tara:strand:- start:80432 stop:80905 length:474 start_codon:yes stop_codon:yes gene_type:complete
LEKIGEVTLYKIFLFLLISISLLSHAQTISSLKKDEILDNLSKLEKMEYENYEQAIFNLNQEILNYSELRKKECLGEFSTLEIDNEGESITKKNTLSKEEKKLCQIELLNFRKKYIKNIYKIRKKHLEDIHQKQIEELKSMQDENLNELDTVLQKLR